MTNSDVARMLRELAHLSALEDADPFRVRTYENAATTVADLERDVTVMTPQELIGLKGVGKSTAALIREFIDTGTVTRLDALRASFPPEFVALTRVPGLGPKTLLMLRDRLGINDLDSLQTAIAAQQLRDLPGMGAKSEEKLERAIARLGLHGKDRRTPIADALPLAESIVSELAAVPGVVRVEYCGSLRRFSETIGDLDIVVATRVPEEVIERFVALPIVAQVLGKGHTKSSVLTRDKLQIDLLAIAPSEFGAALLYLTGSKAHNIALRQRALEKGWTLNEHSLSDPETGRTVASRTEQAIYRKLGFAYIPPELREDSGELAASNLPRPIETPDLRGDLHVHTSLSGDGRATMAKMVSAAAERGLEYLAITDHGEDLAINGASRDQLLRQRRSLRELGRAYPDMKLLHGCELNIGPDGGLDYDDRFLAGFDWCVASVHSAFDLDRKTQTERVISAMRHPAVGAIGHLSGRMIGTRPGIDLDLDRILEAAVATGTAIEINGALERLDASSGVIRQGAGMGVTFVINTDAHHPDEYRRAEWGVRNARRGWLEASKVANTWDGSRFAAWAAAKRGRAPQ